MRLKSIRLILVIMLSMIGLLALALYSSSVKADFPDNGTVIELNATALPIDSGNLRVQIPEQTYVYGILPRYLMELVINAMVCGWVAFAAVCSAFYLLNRRFVWSRKKTASVILFTVIGGVFLTSATWLYQVSPRVLDAEFVYFGFPFVWLSSSRSVFWGGAEWAYGIQWIGLVGNIAFYMWIIFAATVGLMILPKTFSKVVLHGRTRATFP